MSQNSGKVKIIDTYAEAFGMWCCRLVVTASDSYWVNMAAQAATGYGTSIIGCDCEAGIEQYLRADQTPDGRPGAALLFFALQSHSLAEAVVNRAGQCLMTTPTTTVFDGLPDLKEDATAQTRRVALGDCISYFGDGFETKVQHANRNCWSVPVMEGVFHIESDMGMIKGVGGGNLLLCGNNQQTTLNAAKAAVDVVRPMPNVIMPFPGGVVRCGSKVGSRSDPQMIASTHHAYCPTLAHQPDSLLPKKTTTVYELIFDGIDLPHVKKAMRQAIFTGSEYDLLAITAGNYDAKLGQYFIHLHDL